MPKEIIRSWGVLWHPGIPLAKNYYCPDPDCDWDSNPPTLEERLANYKHIVGFSTDVPSRNKARESKGMENKIIDIGGLIFECPHCFTLFWYHAFEQLLDDYIRHCPNWPK